MRVVCCIASGPSLTIDDCELIRESWIETVAVNDSWKMALFAKHIYAGDPAWWRENENKITIDAERWTCLENVAAHHKLNVHGPYRGVKNSGMRAIEFALDNLKADKVILLGYDCSLKNGIHWHGSHKLPLCNPNQERVNRWQSHFDDIKGKEKVVNCSRYTELNAFRKSSLEAELCELLST